MLAASRADFYVDVRGNDAGDGSRSAPFASFERARSAVRMIQSAGKLPEGGLTIWLGPGDFARTNALELGAADSGGEGAPIIWRGSESRVTRILGGQPVAWRPLSPTDAPGRIDASIRSHIQVADLKGWALPDGGGMVSRGFGRATVASHCELFHRGRPMTLARWPNEGTFATITGFPELSGKGDDHGGKIGALEEGFFYSGDRPRRWQDSRDVWVHGYWAWDWANSYEKVASLDLEKGWVRTVSPHGLYGFRKGQRFYFLNVLEELDQPGEWYLDVPSSKLYFWPPVNGAVSSGKEREPEDASILSLLAAPLLRLQGVSNVVFRSLTWDASRGNAIEVRECTDVRIERCVLRNTGNHGVEVTGGFRNVIADCDIRDNGDGGVNLSGGDRARLTPAGHRVENCLFERQGRWSKCYVPAIHMQGVGMRAVGNLIREHPHCGILYWGNDHLIEQNEIHHVALETGDVGAVYTGRDYTFRGNRIRNNFIHHIGGVGMGSIGAYMDDCVSGTEITGNIFYKVQRAVFLGGGRDHRVENNVFVDCNHAVELDGRGLDRSPVWRNMVDRTMRDRLKDVPLALYRERYPELKSLDAHYGTPGHPPIEGDAFHGIPPENNQVLRNVCVGKWLRVGWNAKPEMLRLEGNLTDLDPLFAGPIGDSSRPADFGLRPDSPAWKQGFNPLPVGSMGLKREEKVP